MCIQVAMPCGVAARAAAPATHCQRAQPCGRAVAPELAPASRQRDSIPAADWGNSLRQRLCNGAAVGSLRPQDQPAARVLRVSHLNAWMAGIGTRADAAAPVARTQ